jgi:2TM domain-containing protein
MTSPSTQEDELRQLAITQLRKKRGLQAHALAYLMVNLFLNAVWLLTTPGGFYWPIFPLVGWGIGLAFNVWDVYSPDRPTEERIAREMRRLAER